MGRGELVNVSSCLEDGERESEYAMFVWRVRKGRVELDFEFGR